MLAIIMLKLNLKYGHSLFRILASAGCPKLGFQCTFITAGYDVLGVVWQIKLDYT